MKACYKRKLLNGLEKLKNHPSRADACSWLSTHESDNRPKLGDGQAAPGVCFLKSQHFSGNEKLVKTIFKKLIAFIFSIFFKMRKKVKVKELKKLLAFLADEDLR